jgi:hypothetical protein
VERPNRSPFRQNAAGVLRMLSDVGAADTIPAQLLSSTTDSVVVNVSRPLATGSAVSLEIDGGLILAEVDRCSESSATEYVAHMSIDQVIPSLSELARLMDAITSAGEGASPRQGQRLESDRRQQR